MTSQTSIAPVKPKRSIGMLLLKIFAGLVAFIAAALALVFWLTGDAADAGYTFFTKLREGDQKAAYAMTTPGFQNKISEADFGRFMTEYKLGKGASEPSWSNRKVETKDGETKGKFEGSISNSEGVKQILELQLTKVGEQWRISNIVIEPADGNAPKPAPQISKPVESAKPGIVAQAPVTPAAPATLRIGDRNIPGETELIKLVHASNMVFAKAVNAKSMRGFHDHISQPFQKQFDVPRLDKTFGGFIEKEIGLLGIADMTPAFDGPAAAEGASAFRIKGSYETRPLRVLFEHSYIYEGFGWKLIGFNMTARPVNQPK